MVSPSFAHPRGAAPGFKALSYAEARGAFLFSFSLGDVLRVSKTRKENVGEPANT